MTDMTTIAHETDYTHALIAALNASGRSTRVHRQNVGSVAIERKGRVVGRFDAGPRKGAADISGVVRPWGLRVEIETKHKTKQSDDQIQYEKSMTEWGAVYVLCSFDRSRSIEENVAAAVELVDKRIAGRIEGLREQLLLREAA